jgi:hypothetical protein
MGRWTKQPEKRSAQRNVGAREAKGLEKKMGGVLASTVSYCSTLQLSDALSTEFYLMGYNPTLPGSLNAHGTFRVCPGST